jgi:OOP family OmpA-OmpF porin
LAAAAPAVAQQSDKGWYMGVGFGTTTADIDNSPLTALGATVTGGEDSDNGFKIFGGYQFNKHLGVEVGYVDFGSFTVTGVRGTPFTASFDVSAFTVAAVGTLPLNESFDLFGKAGLYAWEASSSVSGGGLTAGDTSGSDAFLGIGARYNFNRNFGVQLEVEQYLGEDTITVTSIGLRYKF